MVRTLSTVALTLLLTSALTSCVNTYVRTQGLNFTSPEFDKERIDLYADMELTGRDYRVMVLFIPLGYPSQSRAVQNLLELYHETPGAVAISDVHMDKADGGFLIYINEWRAVGNVLIDKKRRFEGQKPSPGVVTVQHPLAKA